MCFRKTQAHRNKSEIVFVKINTQNISFLCYRDLLFRMSDLYSVRKSGLLKLKGEKEKKKKSKKRKHENNDHKESKKIRSAERQDALDHGGWWCATEFKHITGKINKFFQPTSYFNCM